MLSSLLHWLRLLFRRLAWLAFILALAVITYATWLFVNDPLPYEQSVAAHLLSREAERNRVVAEREELESKMEALRGEIFAAQQYEQRAGSVIESLRSLQSFWERWFGNREQQKLNRRQIDHLRDRQKEVRAQAAESQLALTQLGWTYNGVVAEYAQLEEEISLFRQNDFAIVYYLERAWMESKLWLVSGFALLLFGPFVLRFLLYYGVAPSVTRGAPLQLSKEATNLPGVAAPNSQLEVQLWPGDMLRLRKGFLFDSDPVIVQRKRWLLDGRFPIASAACGFLRGLELHNNHIGGESSVLLSAPADMPATDLTEISIPDGSSLAVRPTSIIGIVIRSGEKVRVTRHWHFFRWQSWATLQFGHFRVEGPCRLVIAARKGFRAERLQVREGGIRPARRVTPGGAVAFSPTLETRPVRTDRFFNYWGGGRPLFDMLFAGEGIVLVEDSPKRAGQVRWTDLKVRMLRLAGI